MNLREKMAIVCGVLSLVLSITGCLVIDRSLLLGGIIALGTMTLFFSSLKLFVGATR
jgi:hypothetical protein